MNIQTLREGRFEVAKGLKSLLDANPGAKWNATHQSAYDEGVAKLEAYDEEIGRSVRLAELTADDALSTDAITAARRAGVKVSDDDPRRVFDTFVRRGYEGASAEDQIRIRAAMSTTTGGEGGFTVPAIISTTFYDAMKACCTMRSVAEIIRTSDGRALSFPGSDGTAEVGEWVPQNQTATALDPSFTTVPLNVFKASSKIVAVPFELLQDTNIDMEAFIRDRLALRLGRLGNAGFTVGVGTTQPDGIVPRSTVGKVGTTGQTVTIIYDDVVDLIHAVDPAIRGPRSAFMVGDTLLKVFRKLKDTAGRPLWMPSYDSGIMGAAGNGGSGFASQEVPVVFDFLMGHPVWINPDMPVPAANAKTMLFGDLSQYKIRDAMDVTLFRFTDSAYTKLGQVGFLAWARMGGNLVDTAAVKYYQHSAT